MESANKKAPVFATSEIEIVADINLVWDIMVDIDNWPSWNPDVTWTSLDAELAEGSEFRWGTRAGTITSTLRRVEPPRLLSWTGKGFGVRAVHVWRLAPQGDRTIVRTEESWEGFLARILRGPMQRVLAGSLSTGLSHLKAEAERRAAGKKTVS